ncbi:MAG TPA: SapC family protein [Sphingomonadaceae bacterium]|nr:SapC family protein [Sphingomonadaceae bacterium]
MTARPSASGQPLFYQAPEPLSSDRHEGVRLLEGDYRFAQNTPYVPLLATEFGPASRHYPILFADGDVAAPVALLGLDERNLFVSGEGHWAAGTHIPAYVRRYPFGSVDLAEKEAFALVIDMASDRIGRDEAAGLPLFEGGKPAPVTQRAFAFCDAFRSETIETRAFCEALEQAELLVERQADINLPEGGKRAVSGFRIVSLDAFRALDADMVVDWHRRGWLALVQFHLASLDQFAALLDRRGAIAT